MKKILIAAVCVLAVLVAIIAFSKNKSDNSSTTTTTSSAAEAETTKKKSDKKEDKTEKDNKNDADEKETTELVTKDPEKLVKITMPLSYYDEKNKCDTEGFFSPDSYKSCKVNKNDNTFTVTVKSLTHDFMLTNVGMQVIKSLASLFNSKDYPFVKGLGNYNDNFSEIEIRVDKSGFKASKNTSTLLSYVATCGIFYQLYTTENDYKCTVIIKCYDTDKVLKKETLRYDNNGLKS